MLNRGDALLIRGIWLEKNMYMFLPVLRHVGFVGLDATFNNISVILWRSVLLVEETGENHRPAASHWQTLSHNIVHLAPERDSNSQH
jgi:hypothetical protein